MRKIELTAGEQRVARHLARVRYLGCRLAGSPNVRAGGQSDAVTDLEGVGAELAFCKLFNVWPGRAFEGGPPPSAARGEDGGGDALLCGWPVDVKATKYATGRLLAVRWKRRGPGAFALMVGAFPAYRLKGFMPAARLIDPARLRVVRAGQPPVYVGEPWELVPWERCRVALACGGTQPGGESCHSSTSG